MDLSKAHRYFGDKYYSDRAGGFVGQLMSLPVEVANVYFNAPRRVIKTDPDTKLRAGDLVTGKSGARYICATHGPAEVFGRVIYRLFKLYEVTHLKAKWESKEQYEDPVTGTKRDDRKTTKYIPAVVEFQKSQEDEMRIPSDLVRIIVRDPVKVGDVVEAYLVVNVEPQMGVFIATARRQ